MKSFVEFITEETSMVTAEVTFVGDKVSFQKEAEKQKLTVVYGKNRYADIVKVTGEKSKVDKFLKSKGYFKNEISYV